MDNDFKIFLIVIGIFIAQLFITYILDLIATFFYDYKLEKRYSNTTRQKIKKIFKQYKK